MIRIVIYAVITIIAHAKGQLTGEEDEADWTLLVGIMLCAVIGFIYFDRSQGYRYINYIRHQLGERLRKARVERKKKAQQKQQRI